VVLASLSHRQKLVNRGDSVQFLFFRLFIHFRVVFIVPVIQCWVSAGRNPVGGSSKLPSNHFFEKGIACVF
jgi:hypothetical protein